VDGTGSGSCTMAGFGISGVETSGSTTRVFGSLLPLAYNSSFLLNLCVMHTKFWSEIPRGRESLEDLDVDVRILLHLILE
jgi:hypothetical protein